MAPAPSRASLRFIPVYVALFCVIGLAAPYWPTWLESRGVAPELIGVLLGIGPWVRFTLNPSIGRFADRHGIAHRLVTAGALLLALSYACVYMFGHSFVPIAACVLIGAVGFAPQIPLTDSVALRAEDIDYGRVRAWGSGAFIFASFTGGLLLAGPGPDAILFALVACALAIAASALALPAPKRPPPDDAPPKTRTSAWATPGFVPFIITVALLNGSHAALYGFGTLHWRACGIDEAAIGVLWSSSVIAETLLFMAGDRIGARIGARGLLMFAAAGGVVRWIVLSLSPDFPVVLGAQMLHALTFAAMHLGVMRFVKHRVAPEATAHATSLYSAIATGIALGVLMPLTGLLYARFAGGAFLAMAASSGLALATSVLWLGRVVPSSAKT